MLGVNTGAGDGVVSLTVSGVACELWVMGLGRGWFGVKSRPLVLLMMRLRCPILLRVFQGFGGRALGNTFGCRGLLRGVFGSCWTTTSWTVSAVVDIGLTVVMASSAEVVSVSG